MRKNNKFGLAVSAFFLFFLISIASAVTINSDSGDGSLETWNGNYEAYGTSQNSFLVGKRGTTGTVGSQQTGAFNCTALSINLGTLKGYVKYSANFSHAGGSAGNTGTLTFTDSTGACTTGTIASGLACANQTDCTNNIYYHNGSYTVTTSSTGSLYACHQTLSVCNTNGVLATQYSSALRGFFKFDLSTLPSSRVSSATLYVYNEGKTQESGSCEGQVELHNVADFGALGTGDWSYSDLNNTNGNFIGCSTAAGWVSTNVTADIQRILAGSGTVAAYAMKNTIETENANNAYYTITSGNNGSNQPYLDVTLDTVDANLTTVDGYAFSGDLPTFSYYADGNLTIGFSAEFDGNNSFLVDVNYSDVNTQGSGTPFFTNTKITDTRFSCSGSDFTTPKTCTFQFDPRIPVDGNYFILLKIKDYLGSDYSSHAKSFRILNSATLSRTVQFGNYFTHGDVNYTKDLNYLVTYSCVKQSATTPTAILKDNLTVLKSDSLTCDGLPHSFSNSYNSGFTDANRYIWLNFEIDGNRLADYNARYMIFDYTAPIIVQSDANINSGFSVLSTAGGARLQCTDNRAPTIAYSITNNDANVFAGQDTNNYLRHAASISLASGLNVFEFSCTDYVGNMATATENLEAFHKRFYWVHNATGAALSGASEYNLGDVNSVVAYSYDLNTYFDMLGAGVVSIDYTGTGSDGLYFQVGYTDPAFITVKNEFDLDVVTDENVPMCYSYLQPFYEQKLISSQVKPVIFRNASTQCYLAGADTKYGYSDYFSLSVYTVPGSYYLYTTNDDGNWVRVSLVSGEQSNTINLDSLLLKLNTYDIQIAGESIVAFYACGTTDCNTMQIYYYNSNQDNNSLTISAYKGSTQVYTTTINDANVDEAWLLLDVTSWDLNGGQFEIRAVATKANGTTRITRYYGNAGVMPKGKPIDSTIAFVFGIAVFLVGFTLVSARMALSWFGVFVAFLGIAIMSFGGAAWYILFGQAVLLIVGLYIGLIYRDETSRVA